MIMERGANLSSAQNETLSDLMKDVMLHLEVWMGDMVLRGVRHTRNSRVHVVMHGVTANIMEVAKCWATLTT